MAGLANASLLSHLADPRPTQMDSQGGRQELVRIGNEDEDIDMDSENEGGVLLGSDDDVNIITESPHDSDVLKKYHQANLSESDPTCFIWKLPDPFIVYSMKQIKHSQDHPVKKIYMRHIRLIAKHWNCPPEVCIPSVVRNRTPYSLAMLSALRTFASKTKQQPEQARSLLEDSWRARTSQMHDYSDQGVKLAWAMPNHAGLGRCSEEWIQENMFGLILADVQEAGRRAKEGRARNRKAKKAELKIPRRIAQKQAMRAREGLPGGVEPSRIADRVVSNRRAAKLAAGPMTRFKDELVDVQYNSPLLNMSQDHTALAAPPNSPTAMLVPQNTLTSPTALRQLNSRHNEQLVPAGDEDDVVYNPTKRVRKRENQMSLLLDKIDIEQSGQVGRRKPKKKLRERLQNGGWSREGGGEVAMPSEKFDFNSLPSLRDLAPGTDTNELARMGQLPLPESAAFSIPLRPAGHQDLR